MLAPVAYAARLIVRPAPSSFAAAPRSLYARSCTASVLGRTVSRWCDGGRSLSAPRSSGPFQRAACHANRTAPGPSARPASPVAPDLHHRFLDPAPAPALVSRVQWSPQFFSSPLEAFTLPKCRLPRPVRTLTDRCKFTAGPGRGARDPPTHADFPVGASCRVAGRRPRCPPEFGAGRAAPVASGRSLPAPEATPRRDEMMIFPIQKAAWSRARPSNRRQRLTAGVRRSPRRACGPVGGKSRPCHGRALGPAA